MLILMLLLQVALPTRPVAGVVVDITGAPLVGAEVSALAGGRVIDRAVTAADGTFRLNVPREPVIVLVSAPGLRLAQRAIAMNENGTIRLQLEPGGIAETVTVSADPDDLRVTTTASATVLDREDVATAPAWTLDDQLRTVPGFSLFRRSSSRVSNPTTQGATLRGLAASGASRTLVLADGLPLNDPFGGWVYWDRIPVAAIERVEVVRGGSSDLHGSDALGGVVRIDSAERTGARGSIDAGSDGTARISAYGGRRVGGWQLFGAAETYTTDGFVIVAPESRGAIDVPATSRHTTGYAGLRTGLANGTRFDVRSSYFTEDRGNGTPFQTNATIVRQLAADARGSLWGGGWSVRGYGASQDYDQTFSAVAADRATERPTAVQHVDVTSGGLWVEWLRGGADHAWFASGSFEQVDADLDEGSPGAPALERTPARQRTGALSGQASFTPLGTLTVNAGARGELWQSGRRDGGETRTIATLAPRASVAWRATQAISLRMAFQSAYRLPTVNELYRGFRVGSVITSANAALDPETSYGFEGSALFTHGRAAARTTVFVTSLHDAIVNVTVGTGPGVILRERQNAGKIRAAGIELESDVRLWRGMALRLSATYIDSVFTEGAGLDGLRVPQLPHWQAAAGANAVWSRLSGSVDWRFTGAQFDDDRNQFELDSGGTLNARAGWRIRPRLEVFSAIENAFDEALDVGRTPIRTIGLPRTFRVGVRVMALKIGD